MSPAGARQLSRWERSFTADELMGTFELTYSRGRQHNYLDGGALEDGKARGLVVPARATGSAVPLFVAINFMWLVSSHVYAPEPRCYMGRALNRPETLSHANPRQHVPVDVTSKSHAVSRVN